MGEIADMMLTGVMCAMCGVYLECEDCEDMGIPMYCSKDCFKDSGEIKNELSKYRICNH